MFCANDSAPNLDYLRDVEAAGGTLADGGTDVAVTKNPRQEVQHAHLHAFYAERGGTENTSRRRWLAADVRAAARPWGGSYCSYQLGVDGPFWVMPALGPSTADQAAPPG